MRNIKIIIEYDGKNFAGWQTQPGKISVQGEIEKAIKEITGEECELIASGRTDAGVHALGQRASFKGDFGIPVEKLAFVMNNMLPGDIKIKEAVEVPLNYHARFDAKGKKYIYKIMNCADKNVFKRNFYYYFDKPLDAEKMRKAAE